MPTKIKGISFPFRIGNKGGVVMSETDGSTYQHTVEALQQILLTRKLERAYEGDKIYSDLDTSMFKPNNTSIESLITYEIQNAAKKIEDIEVKSVTFGYVSNALVAVIDIYMAKFDTTYTTTLKVGDLL